MYRFIPRVCVAVIAIKLNAMDILKMKLSVCMGSIDRPLFIAMNCFETHAGLVGYNSLRMSLLCW